MTTGPGAVDGAELDAIRRALASSDTAGGDRSSLRRRPVGLGGIELRADALDALPAAVEAARDASPRSGDVVVLVDATPMRRGGADLKAEVVTRLRAAHPANGGDQPPGRQVVIGLDRPELHADEAALAEADDAIRDASVVVSVGSGTITDIAKDATFRARIPFVVVQTAVSVNAFSDDMAVLLRHGVKRTVPSHWPSALIVDLEAIAGAPRRMNQAGFGELMGMFTAPADWYIANAVGADGTYDDGVVRLYRDGADRLLLAADGVAAAEPEALAELARQMTLTGIAMGVAGRTAPLSGTEHTISHLLDMAAERDGRSVALHGAQVGVASVIVAIAWARLLRDFDPGRLLDDEGAGADLASREDRVRGAFASLDGTGAAADECWRDYSRKLGRWHAAPERRAALAAEWPLHRERLRALVKDPAELVDALRRAGAPTRFSELEPAIPPAVARWAVASCHLMRDRFTVADLVDLTAPSGAGWTDAQADDLLAEAAELGAGL